MCHGPEDPTFTPSEIFSLGTGAVMSSWISPCQRSLVQQIIWHSLEWCDCPYWCLPGAHPLLYYDLTLANRVSVSFHLFFWWPMLIYLPLANLFFLLSTCLWHHTWVTALSPKLLYRFSFSLGLSAYCYQVLKKLGAIKGETDMENCVSKGADSMCM